MNTIYLMKLFNETNEKGQKSIKFRNYYLKKQSMYKTFQKYSTNFKIQIAALQTEIIKTFPGSFHQADPYSL